MMTTNRSVNFSSRFFSVCVVCRSRENFKKRPKEALPHLKCFTAIRIVRIIYTFAKLVLVVIMFREIDHHVLNCNLFF